ncbi:MAG: hypothetical protein H6718_07580 [Polyangiaceae bacterium]|nr:hypothetical protein [Polyangiaceae bacterium]MCB9609974.1 hypothetical protein [Polyangiaceae bacterium]
MSASFRHRCFRGVLVAGLSLFASQALADDTAKVCSTAYEGAQEARKQAQLVSARDKLLVCSQDQCPKFIRQDCASWLEDVKRSIPSFVIVAKDEHGTDVMDFKATLDGKALEGSLSLAIEVDPGKHQLVLTAAGLEPIETEIVLREGEHRRMVELTFKLSTAATAPAESPVEATQQIPEDEAGSGSVLPYVLGGVGVLGVAGFVYFGLSGKAQRSDLESSCKPNCTQSQIDEVDQKFLLADVSLGIGVVSLGIAAYLFLNGGDSSAAPGDQAKRPALDLVALPGGAFAGYSGRF